MPKGTTATAAKRSRKTVRGAVERDHVRAMRRTDVLGRRFVGMGNRVRAEIRQLVVDRHPAAAQIAAEKLTQLVARIDGITRVFLRDQAERTAKQIAALLARRGAVVPMAAMVRAVEVPAEPKEERESKAILLVLLGMLSAGIAAGLSVGVGGSVSGVDAAIDRAVSRGKGQLRSRSVANVNRVTVAVATAASPPKARPIPVAARLPVATPVGPVGKRGPNGPFPWEPPFEILPAGKRGPVPTPGGEPGRIDPTPLSPVPPTTELVGWQVLSMLDDRVRPKHRERHGHKFYYNPRPERGERGMDECPHPPYESQADGGVMAWNCRCRLAPILAGADGE